MKAHCPACGRATRVAEDALDFLVRCERCRTMLLARSPAAGVAGVKTEVLPLGRIPERFGPAQRTDLAELLTRQRRRTLSGTARSVARHAHASHAQTLAGLCMAVVTAIMLATVLGVGYWKLRLATRPASAATVTINNGTRDSETPPALPTSPAPTIAKSSSPGDQDKSPPAPPTSTGDGELFPNVAAQN